MSARGGGRAQNAAVWLRGTPRPAWEGRAPGHRTPVLAKPPVLSSSGVLSRERRWLCGSFSVCLHRAVAISAREGARPRTHTQTCVWARTHALVALCVHTCTRGSDTRGAGAYEKGRNDLEPSPSLSVFLFKMWCLRFAHHPGARTKMAVARP